MLRRKNSLEKWAKEIVRCEEILNSDTSSEKEKEQAEWKIEGIVNLYISDAEATLLLMSYVEKIFFEKDLTK